MSTYTKYVYDRYGRLVPVAMETDRNSNSRAVGSYSPPYNYCIMCGMRNYTNRNCCSKCK